MGRCGSFQVFMRCSGLFWLVAAYSGLFWVVSACSRLLQKKTTGFYIMVTLHWNGLKITDRQKLDSIKMFISRLSNDDMISQASIWDSLAISLASHRESPEFRNIRVSGRWITGWEWNPCHCGERPVIYRSTVYHSASSIELTMDLKRV